MLKKRTLEFYDFYELVKIVDRKLGFDQRDCGKFFFPNTISFNEWCDSKGYGNIDPAGKYRGSSQIWFAEFNKEISENKIKAVPYLDFWHYQSEHCMSSVSNDSNSNVCINPKITEHEEKWIQYIQNTWYEELKNIADNDLCINVWISW